MSYFKYWKHWLLVTYPETTPDGEAPNHYFKLSTDLYESLVQVTKMFDPLEFEISIRNLDPIDFRIVRDGVAIGEIEFIPEGYEPE